MSELNNCVERFELFYDENYEKLIDNELIKMKNKNI